MINEIDIAYDECGRRDTTLLFVHGWCINKEYWDSQKNYFCDKYKVVAIDLPGFGRSGKTRTNWTFEQYADDVNSFIKEKKLKNVILITKKFKWFAKISNFTKPMFNLHPNIGRLKIHPGDFSQMGLKAHS